MDGEWEAPLIGKLLHHLFKSIEISPFHMQIFIILHYFICSMNNWHKMIEKSNETIFVSVNWSFYNENFFLWRVYFTTYQ